MSWLVINSEQYMVKTEPLYSGATFILTPRGNFRVAVDPNVHVFGLWVEMSGWRKATCNHREQHSTQKVFQHYLDLDQGPFCCEATALSTELLCLPPYCISQHLMCRYADNKVVFYTFKTIRYSVWPLKRQHYHSVAFEK